jgi:hypothetical protein
MANWHDVERIALALDGTEARPHVDRMAFRVRRIYATLAPDRLTINLMLTPDEQAMKCMMLPEAYAALPNKWGERGATELKLDAVDDAELRAVLTMAWQHAIGPARKGL